MSAGSVLMECLYLFKEGKIMLQDKFTQEILKSLENSTTTYVPTDCGPLNFITALIPVVAAEVIEAVERPPTETLLAFSRVMRGKLAGNIESIETITQKMTKLDLSKRDDAATFVMMGYTRMYARLFGLESADTVLNVEEFIEIAAKVVKAEYDNLVAQQNVTGPDQKSPMPAISSFIVYTAGYRFLERHIKEHAQQVLPNAERAKEQAANKLVRHEEALQRQASKKKGKRARTDSLQGTIRQQQKGKNHSTWANEEYTEEAEETMDRETLNELKREDNEN